jgi:hypothetical protein
MSTVVGNPPLPPGPANALSSAEQRRFKRFGVKLPCRVKPRPSRKGQLVPEWLLETQDVSAGGMFFVASSDLAIGTTIEVELDLPASITGSQARIRCRGTVARVVPQKEGRIGIGATIEYYRIAPVAGRPR